MLWSLAPLASLRFPVESESSPITTPTLAATDTSARRSFLCLCALVAAFLSLTITLAFHLPMNEAPDEFVHFKMNVRFILDHHRLPIAGQDDLQILSRCRENEYGLLPCTNSYTTYPPLSYLAGAGSAAFWHALLGVKPFFGARFASIAWGTLYLIFIYLSAWRITKNQLVTSLLSFSFAFIPQVIFVSSYMNSDITGLALGALCLLLTLLFVEKPTLQHSLLLGLGAGLLCSSKYNYLTYIPPFALFVLGIAFRRSPTSRHAWTVSLIVGCSAVLIASPWYLRNWLLYDDFLGQTFLLKKMSEFHPLGREWFLDSAGWQSLLAHHWFSDSARSMLGVFGYLNVFLDDWVYQFAALVFGSTLLAFCVDTLRSNNRMLQFAVLAFCLWFLGLLTLSIYHTLHIDFQAQGRYLFPALPLGFAVACYANRVSTYFRKYAVLWSAAILIVLVNAVVILGERYAPGERAPQSVVKPTK